MPSLGRLPVVRITLRLRRRAATSMAAVYVLTACAAMIGAPRIIHASGGEPTALVVLVHASVPGRALDKNTLQAIYLRRQRHWDDGTRIVPLNYAPGDSLRARFDHVVLGLTADQVARHFIDLRIREGTEAPKTVPTSMLAVRMVPKVPGCIVYAPVAAAPEGARVVARIVRGEVQPP